MSARGRTRIYLAVAILVAGVAVVLALLPGEGNEPPSSRAAPRDREPRLPEAPPLRGTEPANPTQGAAGRRAARAVALRFLRALLRFERGEEADEVRRALRATGDDALARDLLARPPRGGSGVSPGRLTDLSLYGPFAGKLKASAQIDHRGIARSLVELSLRKRPAGWRVVAIEP